MIVVASTVAAWKCNGRGEMAWLENIEAMFYDAERVGQELHLFVSVETDARGLEPFAELRARIDGLAHLMRTAVWTFSLTIPGENVVTTGNRLVRICTGRNFAHEYAMRAAASHILFLDTDTLVPGDTISKLLEVDWPIAGGTVPDYGLHGCYAGCVPCTEPECQYPAGVTGRGEAWCARFCRHSSVGSRDGRYIPDYVFPVEPHWNTAGFLLVQRQVFSKLRWRADVDAGLTDDPCFQEDAKVWGFGETRVRKDLLGVHVEPLVDVEDRDADLTRY